MKTDAAIALTEEIQRRIKNVNARAQHYACQYAETDDPANKTAYLQEAAKARELESVFTMVCQTLHALEALIQQPSEKVKA